MAGFNNIGPGSGIKVGYIANEGKPDNLTEENDSHQKIGNPLLHGSSVSDDHYSFSSLMQPPTNFGQQSFPGILDPGTIIYYLAQDGMNGGIILGHSSTTQKGNQGGVGGGGMDLTDSGHIGKVRKSELDVNTPPDVQETTERGAKIKKPVEKGEQHSLSILDGLPIHGALFDMAGFKLPEMKKIPTAKKRGQQMLDQNMLGQLMGQLQSMGGMLQGLKGKGGSRNNGASNLGSLAQQGNFQGQTVNGYEENVGQTAIFFSNTSSAGPGSAGWGESNNRFAIITQNATPRMALALENYSRLVQGINNQNDVSSDKPDVVYLTGNIVHPGTVLKNAEELLSQVNNISDLMFVMRQLHSNTAYHGLDKLSDVTISTNTAWGQANKIVTTNGDVIIRYSEPAKRNMANFYMEMANSYVAGAFTSLDPNTELVLTKVGLDVKEETANTVANSEFTLNSSATVFTEVYSPKLTVGSGIIPKSTPFEERFVSDGRTKIYYLKNQYDPSPGKVSISIESKIIETTNGIEVVTTKKSLLNPEFYLAVDTQTFELETALPENDVIIFSGYTFVVPVNTNPNPNTGGGSGAGGGGGAGGAGAGGGGSGQNIMGQMFGKGSQMMQEMMKRLHPTGEQESKKMTQKLNDQESQKLLEIAKKTINGGDPLDKSLFG